MPQTSDPLLNAEPGSHKVLHFSSSLTALCLMVCVSAFAALLWSGSFADDIPGSLTASRDLERLSSRLLSLESRLSELSALEKSLYHLWWDDRHTKVQLREWYEEIPQERRSALDQLYMGIFDGEALLRADELGAVEVESPGIPEMPIFQRMLNVVYFHRETSRVEYVRAQARLAEEIPANWFYFQLANRLARDSGDQRLEESLQQQFHRLTDIQLLKWRVLVIIECLLGSIGLICFVYLVVMRFKLRAFQSEGVFSQRTFSWTFHEGLAVVVRGGALSVFLILLLTAVPSGPNFLQAYGSLVLYLPTVALVIGLLCWPRGQSLLEVLGCYHGFQRMTFSLPLLLSAIALGFLGEWFIMFGGDIFGISVHWTEWFIPQLVWGSQSELLRTSLEVVVLAPFFEEIIFRGIVFSTLREKFCFPVSLIGSAGIFALAHGYGPIAFLSVFWSGILWAWLYERTGSIVPGMCAHAVNNGLVVYFLVAFFR